MGSPRTAVRPLLGGPRMLLVLLVLLVLPVLPVLPAPVLLKRLVLQAECLR